MAELSEADIALHFIAHFEGFEVFKEVNSPGGDICDIVVKMGKILMAVEVKKSFNIQVIYQALRHKPHCHFTYVAIPELKLGKRNWEAEELCKALGIGVLYFHERAVHPTYNSSRRSHGGYSHVYERVKPQYNRPAKASFKLKEWQKRSIAGSQGERLTDFKITVEEIETEVKRLGGFITAKDFFTERRYHYSSTTSARACIQKLCNGGAITTFRFTKGYITTLDDEALQQRLLNLSK